MCRPRVKIQVLLEFLSVFDFAAALFLDTKPSRCFWLIAALSPNSNFNSESRPLLAADDWALFRASIMAFPRTVLVSTAVPIRHMGTCKVAKYLCALASAVSIMLFNCIIASSLFTLAPRFLNAFKTVVSAIFVDLDTVASRHLSSLSLMSCVGTT